ncbi:hypothetical protein COCVIDRAFT_19890 [Bipolaris victoriae FI3]|uniref:Uncharacterized protein n=1 Tax=Bipolaris victoriae (strain FI3) TaxID=930091 RepID=W7E8W6_BIPV3|nr:hypothetical protein COCVIDRAFT_19890 [Bipolaris victoriae FI3]
MRSRKPCTSIYILLVSYNNCFYEVRSSSNPITSSASAPVTGSYCCTSGANTDPSTGRAAYCCQSGSNPNIGSGCDHNHNYPVGHHDVALSSGGCGPDGNGFVGEQY